MFRIRRSMGCRIAVASAFALLACAAVAYAEDPQVPSHHEKIEITGSNVKRLDGESALPLTTITREEIDKTGATNAVELLQYVTANASAGSVSLATGFGSTTFGAQTANLRGLQGGRTLVLINGKRLNDFAGAVSGVEGQNLAVIPFSAIERVEVLRDGASAVYGSDAIAGVINFILRSDYRGAEATVWLGAPTRSGGGQQEVYSASMGFGDLSVDRYNAFFSAHYNDQHNLLQRDRDFSRSAYRPELGLAGISNNTFPGNVTTGGIGQIAGSAACAGFPYASVFDPRYLSPYLCYFDPAGAPGVEEIPDTKNTNLFISGKFQLNRSWQLYGSGMYSNEETRSVIQPVPVSDNITYGPNGDNRAIVTVSPGTPFYPTTAATLAGVNGQALNVRYRAVLNGNRTWTDTNEGSQWIGGIKGTFDANAFGSWDADLSYSYSKGKVKEAPERRLPALLDASAAAEQRPGEPVRAEQRHHCPAAQEHQFHWGSLPWLVNEPGRGGQVVRGDLADGRWARRAGPRCGLSQGEDRPELQPGPVHGRRVGLRGNVSGRDRQPRRHGVFRRGGCSADESA